MNATILADELAPILRELVDATVAPLQERLAAAEAELIALKATVPRDGAPGKDGVDGKDGLGLAGVLKDHEGWLVFTLADGTMTRVAHVDGKDGAPGRDADPEFIRVTVQDEVQKQSMAPLATAYKGVWKPETYKNGDVVTWGGSLWLAKADTTGKPESTDDWTLIVKRGRDGKDGELKAPAEPKSVKLK